MRGRDKAGGRVPNALITEKSPYLLQHAYNPVNWYPWGKEALTHAKEADKPIFLSIGYSTGHWCHVMARESFENPETAKILNENFVCINIFDIQGYRFFTHCKQKFQYVERDMKNCCK